MLDPLGALLYIQRKPVPAENSLPLFYHRSHFEKKIIFVALKWYKKQKIKTMPVSKSIIKEIKTQFAFFRNISFIESKTSVEGRQQINVIDTYLVK